MDTPLPIRLANRLIDTSKRPVASVGAAVAGPLLLLFFLIGFYPVDIPPYSANPLGITGLFLMFSALPAYLLMGFIASTRLSRTTHASLAAMLPEPDAGETAFYRYSWLWPLLVVLGWIFAVRNNINWNSIILDPGNPAFGVSAGIIFGQLFMWTVIGVVLAFAFNEGLTLYRLGKKVVVDLYDLDRLNIFGRSALINFLIVTGAMALTILQGIDRNFAWEEYRNAFIVGIPAVLLLVPLPIWSVHRNIVAAKKAMLAGISAEIASASRALTEPELHRLNALLQRREQVHKLRNWPMDLSIVGRFVLYVFIPPLAWVGAALVELSVDAFLSG